MIILKGEQITIKRDHKIIAKDLSFQLKAGTLWGVLGPNGSGKTTFLYSLAGLHPLTNGTLYLNQKNMANLSLKHMAQERSILFQDFNTQFPQTVWEFCASGRYPYLNYFQNTSLEDKKLVQHALTLMELEQYQYSLIDHLSGGEKRRLAIATLLVQSPSLYLLDEPTNHLDIKHQMQTLHHFSNIAKTEGRTVMMSLHDFNLAQQFCDDVMLIFPEGEIVAGKTQEILTAENLTRLYQYPIIPLHTHEKRWGIL